jgi:hypothetical protein
LTVARDSQDKRIIGKKVTLQRVFRSCSNVIKLIPRALEFQFLDAN